MKPSPLQLEWVSYPSLRFEARPTDGNTAMTTRVKARVIYYADGHHGAELQVESADADGFAYSFAVHVVATFGFDLARALAAYKCPPMVLPGIVAANVVRVLYSGARELLATATARAPHGTAIIESVLIEPADVDVGSTEPMSDILHQVFGIDKADLATPSTAAKKKSRSRAVRPPSPSPPAS